MQPLADSLALAPLTEGSWSAKADPDYTVSVGMYGGWTAALMLKAVLSDPRAADDPISLNVHYLAAIPGGAELTLEARTLGGSRSLTTWQVEARVGAERVAFATIVLAQRRESDRFTELMMPDAASPDSVPPFMPPTPSGRAVEVRPLINHPPLNQPNTRSLAWIRERTGHPADAVLLTYLADNYAPRVFLRSEKPRPSSTVTLSVYFYATAEDYAAIGAGYVLSDAIATRAESSTIGQRLHLWNARGALLATSEQICWFR